MDLKEELPEEKRENGQQCQERRTFFKKVAYAAPTLVVLGGLLKPKEVKADFGPPPSDPDPDGGW